MPRFSLLLLDAVVVIDLHALDLWSTIIERCEVHVTKTVADECKYWFDKDGQKHIITLGRYEKSGEIIVHDIDQNETANFAMKFGPDILRSFDAGEADTLAFLCSSLDGYKICSADKIVFRILGALKRSDDSISLEEVLHDIGIKQNLHKKLTKAFRLEWCYKGFSEGLQGLSNLK